MILKKFLLEKRKLAIMLIKYHYDKDLPQLSISFQVVNTRSEVN